MNTPFPGMDPYLEHPTLWADVHDRLIAAIADALVPLLAPKYYVGLQRHAYLLLPGETVYLGKPDVAVGMPTIPQNAWSSAPMIGGVGVLEVEVPMQEEVDENYLEVREVKTGKLITIIEILSSLNKSLPEGRQEYIEKRHRILRTRTNLVEIDLLRGGQPMTVFGANTATDYRILISPAGDDRAPNSMPSMCANRFPPFPCRFCPKKNSRLCR